MTMRTFLPLLILLLLLTTTPLISAQPNTWFSIHPNDPSSSSRPSPRSGKFSLPIPSPSPF